MKCVKCCGILFSNSGHAGLFESIISRDGGRAGYYYKGDDKVMWYGKDTDRLKELRAEYKSLFGYNPDGETSVEYDQSGHKDYIHDLEKAIKTKKHLAEIAE